MTITAPNITAAEQKLHNLLARCSDRQDEQSTVMPDPVAPARLEWQVIARLWPDGVAAMSLTAYDRTSGEIVRRESLERHCADAAALAALAVLLRID